jgi:hypothetical protein
MLPTFFTHNRPAGHSERLLFSVVSMAIWTILIFGIDPGREVIEQNIHRLTSYEYFVARTLDQMAFCRHKWFWLIHIDLAALLFLNTLFSKNRWARSIEGVLLLAFILLYGKLCCALTKSTCLWSLLWKQVSNRTSQDEKNS